MNKEEQIGTLVGLDLILLPEHYKEITKLQQENKQLKEKLNKVEKILLCGFDTQKTIFEALGVLKSE